MKPGSSIESFPFLLAKCVFALSIIFLVLIKPFSSCVLELSEETIELTSEAAEKDLSEEFSDEFAPDFLVYFENLAPASQQERPLIAFSSTQTVSHFRSEIVLPPPEC